MKVYKIIIITIIAAFFFAALDYMNNRTGYIDHSYEFIVLMAIIAIMYIIYELRKKALEDREWVITR